MALLIVLFVVTLLIIVTVQFASTSRVRYVSGENSVREVQAVYALLGGVNLVKELFKGDDPQMDSANDGWAKEVKETLGDAEITIRVTDEESRIFINVLVDDKDKPNEKIRGEIIRLVALLNALRTEDEVAAEEKRRIEHPEEAPATPEEIAAALVDWIDRNKDGDYERDAKAEEENGVKNAPLATVGELLLVAGITPDLYHGNADAARPGLKDLVTVSTKGGININTAGSEVLQVMLEGAVPGQGKALADAVVAYRKPAAEGEPIPAFARVEDLRNIPTVGDVYGAIINYAGPRLAVKSAVFRLEGKAVIRNYEKRVTALVVRPEKQPARVIFWKEE
ncbi:MAG: hypothetical protein V1809_02875 [Planctomycetota bacterium]